MLPSFARKTITVSRAPYIDSRGTKVKDWEHAVDHTVAGCSLQPVQGDTAWTDTTQAVTVRARLFLPPDADVRPDDRITADGFQYAIAGAPMPWESPTGAVDHIEASLIDWRL